MHTVPPLPDRNTDRPASAAVPLPAPRITPEWVAQAYWAAVRGLPPDPWPLP